MADTAQYSMNQFRYNGDSGICMEKMYCTPLYLDWRVDNESAPFFRDVLIDVQKTEQGGNTTNLETGSSYYFRFGVPRDLNYDFNISVKMFNNTLNFGQFIYSNSQADYQFVRYVPVSRAASNGSKNSLVCLYQIKGEENDLQHPEGFGPRIARAALVSDNYLINPEIDKTTIESGLFYQVVPSTEESYTYYKNFLYHNKIDDFWWMFNDRDSLEGNISVFGTNSILAGQKDAVLNWIWQTDASSNITYYDMIITPQTKGFRYILLQLERINEDKDIITDQMTGSGQYLIPDPNNSGSDIYTSMSMQGRPIYGRYIDLNTKTGNKKADGTDEIIANTFKIYKLNNLNNASTGFSHDGPIKRLGIWGHPQLMMAINGEQIQIGSSGYYELNDFNIETFCVVADGYKDNFVVDYQYEV